MTIKEDAGEILLFLYDCYVNDKNGINPKKLLEITKWKGERIDRALNCLNDLDTINITFLLGNEKGLQNFIFEKITPIGINIVENQPIKRNFCFEVNLGLLKFSWGVSEK